MAIAKVDRSVEQKPRFSVPFGVEGKLILPISLGESLLE
jgi:hypothetical protein